MEKINFISVVIASHDQKLIETSIQSFDYQSYPKFDFEINVVCHPAVKASLRKLQITRPWLHYFSITEYSLEQAQILGIQCSKSDIIAFTEEGCLPQYDWIEKINRHFNENIEHLCVFGTDKEKTSYNDNSLLNNILSNAAFKKDTFRQTIGIDLKKINNSCSFKELRNLLNTIGEYGVNPQLKVDTSSIPLKHNKKHKIVRNLFHSLSHMLYSN